MAKGNEISPTRMVEGDRTLYAADISWEKAGVPRAKNQEASLDDGTRLVVLGQGSHYTLPAILDSMQAPDEMLRNGFGLEANAICIIDLSPQYSLVLFDRGADKQGQSEPLVSLPMGSHKRGVMVSDRFFMIDQPGFVRVGMSAATGKPRDTIGGFTQFCAGSTVRLGRALYDTLNYAAPEDLPESVSRLHAAIDASMDGRLTITDTHSVNRTAIQFKPVNT